MRSRLNSGKKANSSAHVSPNTVVSVSATPSPLRPAIIESGRKTSISRIRLRAMTWSIDRPAPARDTTLMPTIRLPGVAARRLASKAMK